MKNAWRGEGDSGSLYTIVSSIPLYAVASTDSADHTQP